MAPDMSYERKGEDTKWDEKTNKKTKRSSPYGSYSYLFKLTWCGFVTISSDASSVSGKAVLNTG